VHFCGDHVGSGHRPAVGVDVFAGEMASLGIQDSSILVRNNRVAGTRGVWHHGVHLAWRHRTAREHGALHPPRLPRRPRQGTLASDPLPRDAPRVGSIAAGTP